MSALDLSTTARRLDGLVGGGFGVSQKQAASGGKTLASGATQAELARPLGAQLGIGGAVLLEL